MTFLWPILITIVLWMAPTLVAIARGPAHKGSIVVVSTLLGWFPLVSIGCLVWALVDRPALPSYG